MRGAHARARPEGGRVERLPSRGEVLNRRNVGEVEAAAQPARRAEAKAPESIRIESRQQPSVITRRRLNDIVN